MDGAGVGLTVGVSGAGDGAVRVGCGVTYVVAYMTLVTVTVLLDVDGETWGAEDAWAAEGAAA